MLPQIFEEFPEPPRITNPEGIIAGDDFDENAETEMDIEHHCEDCGQVLDDCECEMKSHFSIVFGNWLE